MRLPVQCSKPYKDSQHQRVPKDIHGRLWTTFSTPKRGEARSFSAGVRCPSGKSAWSSSFSSRRDLCISARIGHQARTTLVMALAATLNQGSSRPANAGRSFCS